MNTSDIRVELKLSEALIKDNNLAKKEALSNLYQIKELDKLITEYNDRIIIVQGAANLLNQLMDTRLREAMDFITDTINDALSKVFPRMYKRVSLDISSFNDTYPQLNVVLLTKDGVMSLKNQEGTALKQLISVMYILCLIYTSGKRKFVYLDEVLDGFHEDAIEIMDTILDVFIQELGFQIMINEHGYPRGANSIAYFLELQNENDGTYVASVESAVGGSVPEIAVN